MSSGDDGEVGAEERGGHGSSSSPSESDERRGGCCENRRPCKCHVCYKTTARRSRGDPTAAEHGGGADDGPYVCVLCDKRFARNVNLRRHFRTHARRGSSGGDWAAHDGRTPRHRAGDVRRRPYVCVLCDRAFAEQANLMRHYSHDWTPGPGRLERKINAEQHCTHAGERPSS